ncbi:Glycerophosphoryl diester phosphodiesterase [Vibrio aerogenes CECT 7868]|uniref:Glycerophosphoryl diester phosphodiesterase n=1 Tax=Vibrio aerogenes CECT 7868 TaxID=1216006 RepID=A0A1M5XSU4_9VIBR|nr:glycerophosphodiester phosphodiesterase family protein [Vibrio aerogenes]SHI02333.1 Glycerophosphoryl diester phosphodiesterase [Vibrio aerogenes CECT 7868]
MKPIIVGHRGVAGTYPENTRASFLAAAKAGLTWIELDVQPTADDILVVCHDHELGRCSDGQGRVDAHSLQTLKQLDFGAWFGPEFAGEQLLTLGELFVLLHDYPVAINIEIKVDDMHDKAKVVRALYQELSLAKIDPHRVILSSFNHEILKICHQTSRVYPLAVLTEKLTEGDKQLMQDIGAVACNINYRALDAAILQQLHQAGLQVWVYTVNKPEQFSLTTQVDGIFTDYPERFIERTQI